MRVKAVFDLEIPDDLVVRCQNAEYEAYNAVFKKFADGIAYSNSSSHNFDEMQSTTCIEYYRFYDDTCNLLFES